MTRNGFEMNITLTRKDVCDLMLACSCAKRCGNDEGKKWQILHDNLKLQLKSLDDQLDKLEND